LNIIEDDKGSITLSNPFTCLEIDKSGSIISLYGSLLGDDKLSDNTIGGHGMRIVLMSDDASPPLQLTTKWLKDQSEDNVALTITTTSDAFSTFLDNQRVSLGMSDRFFSFSTSTSIPQGAMSFRTFPFRTSSTTAFYDSGPVQMKDAWDGSGSFSSNETVSRFYSLGPEGGDVSDTIPSRAADLSVDLSFGDDSGAVTMILSGVDSITWNGGDEEAISTFVQVRGGWSEATVQVYRRLSIPPSRTTNRLPLITGLCRND